MTLRKPMVAHDHTFTEDGEFDGMIGGNAYVAKGVHLTLTGMVAGNLVVEADAVVRLHGMVGGQTINRGGSIIA